MEISFGGLATGLDTNAIISALLDVERIPILRAEQRRDELRSRNSTYGELRSRLGELETALRDIRSSSDLSSFSATSSNEDALRVTASGDANTGTYAIRVFDLATNQTDISSAVADSTAAVGGGDISFTVDGTTTTVNLGAAASIDDIATAINQADAGVTATVINDGTTNRLTLTAQNSGADGYTLDTSSFVALGGFSFTSADSQAGQDARFSVNGLTVTRSSNEITDVIAGVTLDLRAGETATGLASTVTINPDTEGTKEKIQTFLDAYNAINSIISAQGQVDDDGNPTGSLFGDSGVRSIQGALRGAIQNVVGGTGSFFTTLSTIGIRTDASGNLSIDSSDFDDAIGEDRSGVISLFTDSSSGVVQNFLSVIDSLTGTNGVIATREDGIESRIRSFDDQIRRLEDRLVRFEERLVNQFAALETTVANLQAQGSALTGALGGGGG